KDAIARATANRPVAARVTRRRTDPRRTGSVLRVSAQAIAGAAHGADEVRLEWLVDLAPQVADVHLDDVRVAREVHAPDVVEDLGLGRDVSVPAHQVLEQRELAARQADLRLAVTSLPAGRVEPQRSELEDGRPRRRAAPEERAPS